MQDILLEKNSFELAIAGGDLLVELSDEQHISLLLYSQQGQWRQHPTIGCNLRDLVNDEDPTTAMRKVIQQQMELDGAEVLDINLDDPKRPTVEAIYK